MNHRTTKSLAISLIVLALLLPASLESRAQVSSSNGQGLAEQINALCEKTFKADEPGAAVIVVKDGKVLFRRGYGMANMELGVKIEPDMIFRIGSVTKQFTAVAILMLMEQGKLALTDDITKFLPDYPTQGQKITIEHLLTHTSGIVSYTGLPEWRPQWRKDVTMNELIALFKDKPMEFAPGTKWNYNNSAFVLLGVIIEKISGLSYGEFLEKHIFAPLGMKTASYDNTARIVARRAAGYSRGKEGFINCDYLSMSWPHAAGALMASVDDLALWDAALYTEKIIKQDSLKRAWTPYVLNNGKKTKYGYGWGILTVAGHRSVEHGGGINGFTCDAIRWPDDRLYIAILTNRDLGTGTLAHQVAALVTGASLADPKPISLPTATLDQFVGVYENATNEQFVITRKESQLTFQHPQFGGLEIKPVSETEFIFPIISAARLKFTKDASGKITGFAMSASIAPDEEAKKTDKPLPKPKEAATIDPAIYDNYVGEYELAPNFVLTISKENNKLIGQATGQSKIELVPQSKTRFSVAAVGAEIEFVVDASGIATSLNLFQGGRTLPAKRIK